MKKIPSQSLQEHYHIQDSDFCFYFLDYNQAKGFYKPWDENPEIYNLKCSVNAEDDRDIAKKAKSIELFSKYLRDALEDEKDFQLIPMPPSRHRDDALYDDRMTQICSKAYPQNTLDIISRNKSVEAAHSSGNNNTRNVNEIYENLSLEHDANLCSNIKYFIVDDVLTTGASFKAAQKLLKEKLLKDRLSNMLVHGIFMARRCLPDQI